MQANDDNENEDGAVEGLVDLGAVNPYQGAPIHRGKTIVNFIETLNSEGLTIITSYTTLAKSQCVH